jgi:hypothetical protein
MTALHAEEIIAGYVARLERSLAGAPAAPADELKADVQAHIAEARSALTEETDADLLNILDRLGDPGALAVEVGQGAPLGSPGLVDATQLPGPARREFNAGAIIALLVIAIGPWIPPRAARMGYIVFFQPLPIVALVASLVSLIIGLTIARKSGCWTDRDLNYAGLLPFVIGPVAVLLVNVMGSPDVSGLDFGFWVWPPLSVLSSAGFLLLRRLA